MNNEFKKIKNTDETRYVLEMASAGATSSGAVATVTGGTGKVQKRGNILAQESDKKKDAAKPRNFVAKNAKMGGAGQHKDKKKAEKQGTVKHKKPYAESIDALKNKLDTLKEAFGRRDAYQRDYDSSVSGMGKRDSLAYRMDGGANDEGEDDFQNNYGVWINGRMWKVFATQHSANAVARSLQAKGKDAKVGLTSAPVKEQGVAEGYTTEKQILTRIRQIMYDRKLSGTESNAGELHRLKQQLKDMRSQQGVAEATGLYGPFTVTINTGERPQSRTKTKKFRREDDAILWAEDWLEDAPQYVFATAEVTDPDGNVVWTTDEQGVAEAEKKGLYYYVNKRKKAGTSRPASSPKAPSAQAWKDAAKTAKTESASEGFNGEYDDEAGMAKSNLLTTARAVMGLLKTIKDRDNLPEWGQEKIAKAEMMLVSVWDYLQSQKQMGNDPQQDMAEGYYDLNDPGMQPIDLASKPSFSEIVVRYSQLYYQSHEGEYDDEEATESDAIEQYVAKRFGEKGSAHLQKAAETSFFGRDDKPYGRTGARGDNLGRASQPSGNFRTTKAGKMHGQDAKVMKNKVSDRLGRHPEPALPEGEQRMSRAAKGYEKYGKKGMKALAKAGRDGASEKKLDAIRDKHDNYNEGIDPYFESLRAKVEELAKK